MKPTELHNIYTQMSESRAELDQEELNLITGTHFRTTAPVWMPMTERDDMPRIDPHDFTNSSRLIDLSLNMLALETLVAMNKLSSNDEPAIMLHGASAMTFNLTHPSKPIYRPS